MKDYVKYIIFVASGIILGVAAMLFIVVLPAKYRADTIIAKQAGEIATLRSQFNEANTNLDALENQLTYLDTERTKLAENLRRVEATAAGLRTTNKRLGDTISGLEAELRVISEGAARSQKLLEELGGLTESDIQILRDLQNQQRESSP